MPAFKYKTEEGHQKHLAYRREWYQRNKDRINQQKRRRRATKKAEQGNKKPRTAKPQMVALNNNPQLDEIMQAIQDESIGKT